MSYIKRTVVKSVVVPMCVSMISWLLVGGGTVNGGVIEDLVNIVRPRTPIDRPSRDDIRRLEAGCIAMAIAADALHAPMAVQEAVGLTVLQNSVTSGHTICQIAEAGLTLIPFGETRPRYWLGRWRTVVEKEAGADAWALLVSIGYRVLDGQVMVAASCRPLTHYIRAPRITPDATAAQKDVFWSSYGVGLSLTPYVFFCAPPNHLPRR